MRFCKTCSIGSMLWAMTVFAVVSLEYHAVNGQGRNSLTSDAVIQRIGLTVEWSSQAPVGAANQLVDWELFVDENQATTTIEVRAENQREIISEFDRNPRGEIYGVEGAEKQAENRREYLLASFAARGKKDVPITIEKFTQPKATLFLLTDSGDVTAIDANNGKTLWLSRVGSHSAPGIGLGVNSDHVAVVRGSVVHCLEAKTGKELWSKACKYAVGSSPAVTDKHIMVPLTDGRLELFPIDTQGLGSHALMALGEGTAQPLVTTNSVSWPTTRGELNVMIRGNGARSISYRLRSDAAIVSSATNNGKTLFVGSLDGFLYALDELRGSVRWAISLGVGIPESPVPLGDYVFAISGDKKLYKVVAATGELAPGWGTPLSNISRFAGASEKNLYLIDAGGGLAVVDRESKAIINRVRVGQVDLILNNYQTDRLYVASKSGVIQCLHEIGSKRPHFHGDEAVDRRMMSSGTESKTQNASTPLPDENPFGDSDDAGGSENPFGGLNDAESDESSDEEDPFGSSDEDPFG